jgi:hypothetical protein
MQSVSDKKKKEKSYYRQSYGEQATPWPTFMHIPSTFSKCHVVPIHNHGINQL